jgi:hypothetical protein
MRALTQVPVRVATEFFDNFPVQLLHECRLGSSLKYRLLCMQTHLPTFPKLSAASGICDALQQRLS